jgi:hypothetical protein
VNLDAVTVDEDTAVDQIACRGARDEDDALEQIAACDPGLQVVDRGLERACVVGGTVGLRPVIADVDPERTFAE